ncbi:MAG TPA: MFS transporter [Micropepsaceae bacterium]|nr:MFS transporter [Micropepsaceae bacterium]
MNAATFPGDVLVADIIDTDSFINESRVSRLQIMVGVLGALILFVDGFNTQVIGYIAPQIAKNWNIPRDVLGWILAADKVGLLIGYLFVAPLSGYFGHKRVAIGCIVLFGLLAWMTTIAGDTRELFVLRLLTGIGLGGALPSGVALTGEYFPLARRSTAITFIYCGLSFGQLSAGEVSNAVLAPFGWQAALWVGGGLALLLAATLALLLPESLEYLVNRGGKAQAAQHILSRIDSTRIIPAGTRLVAGERDSAKLTFWQLLPQLFQNGRIFGTLVIWLALGMNLTVNTSLQVWLTKILVDAGFGQHIAIIATEASFAAGIVGAFIIGPLMDRYGPYRVITALFVVGAAFSIFLGLSLSWTAAGLIATCSFGSGFCTSGVQKGGNALCVFFYPTALRSTGLGWGLGIGRIGAILGPLAVGYLLTSGWPSGAVFGVMAVPMLVGAAAILAMGRSYGETSAQRATAPAKRNTEIAATKA